MSAIVAAQRRHRVMPTPDVANEMRRLLLEKGEYHASAVLGVSRSVAVRAAARLPLTRADHEAIIEGLRELAT